MEQDWKAEAAWTRSRPTESRSSSRSAPRKSVPFFSARRVHWGLPDPAAATGSDDRKLQAFRDVRDELRRRLAVVFGR